MSAMNVILKNLHVCRKFVILKHLRCFVVNLTLSRVYALFGIKFWSQKLRSCKKIDKYHVWCRLKNSPY